MRNPAALRMQIVLPDRFSAMVQSIFAPERFTTSANFADSFLMNAAYRSGVPPNTDCRPRRGLSQCRCRASLVDLGVELRKDSFLDPQAQLRRPRRDLEPATPASAIVGSAGTTAWRVGR